MNRFTIALSGLSDTDAAMFEAALDALPDGKWQLVDNTRAYLLVVDIDSVWGHMDWLRATANGQQVVAYTRDGNIRHCELVLTKPLRTSDLSDLLNSIASGDAASLTQAPAKASAVANSASAKPKSAPVPVTAAATETAAPLSAVETPATATEVACPTPSAPVERPVIEPLPSMTLGECLLNDKLTHPCSLHGADGTLLQLDPERGGYTGSSTLKPLQALLGISMEHARDMPPDAVDKMREAPALPLTRLLWFAALSASPGELAPNLDRQARYHLTRWPQIEREFPRHFRIATTMMKGPGSLGDIASMANSPVGDVADFINAYSVAGYVSCAGASSVDNEATTENGNGMLSRLRRPFARGGQP